MKNMYRLDCLNWGEPCRSADLPDGCPDRCPTYACFENATNYGETDTGGATSHDEPETWYDVHFSLSGFMKIQAENEESAKDKAEDILSKMKPRIEDVVKTGVGIEISEAYE
jgi:hypothetical protein